MASVHDEWLGLVRPTGVVVEPRVLDELGIVPERLSADDGLTLEALLEGGKLRHPQRLLTEVLGWSADLVPGLSGEPIPEALRVRLDEQDTTLEPSFVVPDFGGSGEPGWQLVGRLEAPGISPDGVNQLPGWEASPHHRLERLLRDTGVPAGLLITDDRVRLVTAPKGETSGWLDFLIQPMTEVAGRPILAAMKLLLGPSRFFWGDRVSKLPALLQSSRQAQDNVSSELSRQVLAALHELLRGLYAADPTLVGELTRERPQYLYEGLLTVLMRLVFVLYAEDRDLMPSRRDGDWLKLYENSYSLRGLHNRLEEDAALYADTMDERRGAWGQLLALFRLVAAGDEWGWMQARRGKLFDPDSFAFLEGRRTPDDDPAILPVSDGCIRRILDQLVMLNGRRLSYRSLDVEQIGSVYETIMGFTVEPAAGPSLAIKAGKNNRTPVFVDLSTASAQAPKDRLKWLKDHTGRDKFGNFEAAIKAAPDSSSLASALASVVDERASPGGRTVSAGTPVLQPTAERRRTGSHYTPRSLTEPIVRKALEPVFQCLGPNALPEQVLELKVCDPAMGSGAFLVETCRQIGERLVTAWVIHPEKRPAIPSDEDEIVHARRLVAQRCIYGVDRNPMAVDLAKLSLWLATLARDHEFTFLDHALKCGDSLVGLAREQIENLSFTENMARQKDLWRHEVGQMLKRSLKRRIAIQVAGEDVATESQAAQLNEAEQEITQVRLIGDAMIACFFGSENDKQRRFALFELSEWVLASKWEALRQRAACLQASSHSLQPFHWSVEFPEVFERENGGFDNVVGNPPFLGGTLISRSHGTMYLHWLLQIQRHARDRADLVSHFFVRAVELIRQGGVVGLVATNSISQGDTQEAVESLLNDQGASIIHATRRLKWPGEAAVIVSVVHIHKASDSNVERTLDGIVVDSISSYLVKGTLGARPRQLSANISLAFEGYAPYGDGFLFGPGGGSTFEQMEELLTLEPRAKDLLRPYLGGSDILSSSTGAPARYALYTAQMDEAILKSQYPMCYNLLYEKVRSERLSKSKRVSSSPWWQFLWARPKLTAKMRGLQRVIVRPKVSTHHIFAIVEPPILPSNATAVICLEGLHYFSVLQSRVHELWARFFGSTMKDDLRYTPTDCFNTYPMPLAPSEATERVGRRYLQVRTQLMSSYQQGLTAIYNRFNDEGETDELVQDLRIAHAEMDAAVLQAYGWDDLAAEARAQFLDGGNEFDPAYLGRLFWPASFREEVFRRLLALNQSRAGPTCAPESVEAGK